MRRTVVLAIAMVCFALSCTVQPGPRLLLAVEADRVDRFAPDRTVLDEPPLRIKCLGQCRPPNDRGQAYDPATGVFHVEFSGGYESGFEMVKVARGNTKTVVFHLTGLLDMYGFDGLPLTLAVDGKHYLIDMKGDHGPSTFNLIRDDTLFRVERRFVTEYTYERPVRMIEVTVKCTEKGRSLLKPRARFFCIMGHYW